MSKTDFTKAPCRKCHGTTTHRILHVEAVTEDHDIDDYNSVWTHTTSEMLKCLGCETISLRQSSTFSEDPEPSVSYYPPPVSRRNPAWKHHLPINIIGLLSEVYSALNSDNKRLTLMGARTVVDVVMLQKVGDIGSFDAKLEAMEKAGMIAPNSRQFLEAALDAGNAAAHRGFNPTVEQISHVMDIVENMLQNVYVLEKAARKLREVTPPRPPRPPKE